MKNLIFIFGILLPILAMGQNQTINGHLSINPGSNDYYNQGIRISESASKWSLVMLGATASTSTGTNENGWIMGRASTLNFVISRNSADGLNGMVITKSGNVGFGVAKPTSKLEVNGTIRAKEVKIEATGWADFVFDPDYDLPSLSEVKKHIEEKQHLPNIPSAAEMKESGVDVGEMQVKLLQKIEELTLYVIELDKRDREKDKLIKELQLKIK